MPLFLQILSSPTYTKENLKESLMELSLDKELAEEVANNMEQPVQPRRINGTALLLFFAPYVFRTVVFNIKAKALKDKLNLLLNPRKQDRRGNWQTSNL